MSETTIREALPTDADALHAYLVELISENLPTITLSSRPSSVEQLKVVLKHYADLNNSIFLLAILDGNIIGQLDFAGGLHEKRRHAGVVSTSVHRDYRGQGIGTRLLEGLFEWASSNPHITRVELEVLSNNQQAQDLYSRLGFIIEGIKRSAVIVDGQPVDSVAMARFFPNTS